MFFRRAMLIGLLGGLALGTAACTDGYGYSGVSVGAGSGFYGDPYYAGGGIGSGYYGWYDNFYYPGAGSYVYDRYRRARPWSGAEQHYWQQRRYGLGDRNLRPDWRGFRPDRARGDRGRWRDGQPGQAQQVRPPRGTPRPATVPRPNRVDGIRPPRPDRGPGPRRQRD